jgi:hypothetical protein
MNEIIMTNRRWTLRPFTPKITNPKNTKLKKHKNMGEEMGQREEMEGNVSIYSFFDEFDGLNTVTYLI